MRTRRILLPLIACLALALPAAAAENLVQFEELRGIPVANVVIRNIAGGGLPWSIERGDATLKSDGTLKVDVRGLVLAAGPNAGGNPIGQFIATVSCLNGDGTINNVSSAPVPASPDGDARIHETLVLPETCLAPVIFVQGFPNLRWFAVSGF
jgi:hypothetical protein